MRINAISGNRSVCALKNNNYAQSKNIKKDSSNPAMHSVNFEGSGLKIAFTIGGAIAGGLLGGPIGAVVGAAAGYKGGQIAEEDTEAREQKEEEKKK